MKIFLLPPPGLPVPAVKGGAVETLITHLIEQNEKDGKLDLVCVCTPDIEAEKIAARYKHCKVYFLKRSSIKQKLWGPLCGLLRRSGKAAPLQYWYHEVLQLIKKENPDFLIAEGGDLTEPEEICRYLGRSKCFAHLHMQLTYTPQLGEMYSKVICISRFVADSYHCGDNVVKYIVPNCVDTEIFSADPASADESLLLRNSLGILPEQKVILFVGRICPEKGIGVLIDAFIRLNSDQYRLVIVGSPFFAAKSSDAFMKGLQNRAQTLGDRIIFTGFIPNRELPAYYRMADCACFPALWDEPAGITAIEAMACGCPIIATDSGGMPEYLGSGTSIILKRDAIIDDNGKMSTVEGAKPLADCIPEALQNLFASPSSYEKISRACVEQATQYDSSKYYKNLCRCFFNN